MSVGTATVVVPGDIDDPKAPSGGNRYDRRVCDRLTAHGWDLRELALPGSWPDPSATERAELARALATVADGTAVLLDGLVAGAAADVIGAEAHRLGLAVVVHLPLADETGLPPDAAARLDGLERETLRAVSAVVTTSSRTGRRLIERHELPVSRVHVAVPGVDPAPLATGTDGATRLVCVAELTPRKGQDVLVEALARVTDLPWTCVLVGGVNRAPDFVDRLRQTVETYGLGERVRLVGPLTGADLAAQFATADLLILASLAETYGMVVTEALAWGIPVLATGVDGVAEAMGRARDGSVPGLLVPAGDPAALADAVRRWLVEPQTRDQLRAAAQDRRETLLDWDTTAQAIGGVLARVRPRGGR